MFANLSGMMTDLNEQTTLVAGDIEIDSIANQVLINGQPHQFTLKEYQLLSYLIINQDKVVTKRAIVEKMWGANIGFTENLDFVYTHLKNIRKKLQKAGSKVIVRSVYGAGYKLVVLPHSAESFFKG